jgi:hypothetical protein
MSTLWRQEFCRGSYNSGTFLHPRYVAAAFLYSLYYVSVCSGLRNYCCITVVLRLQKEHGQDGEPRFTVRIGSRYSDGDKSVCPRDFLLHYLAYQEVCG